MMRPIGLAARLRSSAGKPRWTLRVRLTLLYGGTFLVCGAALLAVTYALVSHGITGGEGIELHGGGGGGGRAAPGGGKEPLSAGSAIPLPPATLPKPKAPPGIARIDQSPAGQEFLRAAEVQLRVEELHRLEIESAIALGIMAILSALLGWFVAGRALRPLRTITATAREISAASLDRRLALEGPADELKDLGDTIDALLARLEDSFTAQRAFIANASHELRTPLALSRAMLGFALADPDLTFTALKATCQEVFDAGSDHDQLIEALLILARSQQGVEHRQPVSLAAAVEDVISAPLPPGIADGIKVDIALTPAWVSGDPRLIRQLVTNLVENALRYNVPDGEIRVSVEAHEDHAILTVDNTGRHVPADQIERLLQPFQRLKPDRTGDNTGHGLGLSIVRAITTAHNATLQIQPNPDGGLRVRISFLLAAAAEERPRSVTAAPAERTPVRRPAPPG
jgi:signal transduction histidine kinase